AQKAVSAIDASVAEATCSVVMSSWDQLPFIVSQMPYNTAKPANSQNAGGTRVARPLLTAVLAEVCSGSLTLKNTSTESSTADSTGRPHQNPSPTNIATNTGASAVPSPSRALRTKTARSTPSGWKSDTKVLMTGT